MSKSKWVRLSVLLGALLLPSRMLCAAVDAKTEVDAKAEVAAALYAASCDRRLDASQCGTGW